jgi:hypoxanthine phosphoribosyltransferase
MKATVAVVACLTKAYTSGQHMQITSIMAYPWNMADLKGVKVLF